MSLLYTIIDSVIAVTSIKFKCKCFNMTFLHEYSVFYMKYEVYGPSYNFIFMGVNLVNGWGTN